MNNINIINYLCHNVFGFSGDRSIGFKILNGNFFNNTSKVWAKREMYWFYNAMYIFYICVHIFVQKESSNDREIILTNLKISFNTMSNIFQINCK